MAKPATLDKTRSYGVSKGLGDSGVRFTQDHKNFDHHGIEIMPLDTLEQTMDALVEAAKEDQYDDWPWKKLVAELKSRTGRGPKGMKRPEVEDALRELDAAEAVDDGD